MLAGNLIRSNKQNLEYRLGQEVNVFIHNEHYVGNERVYHNRCSGG